MSERRVQAIGAALDDRRLDIGLQASLVMERSEALLRSQHVQISQMEWRAQAPASRVDQASVDRFSAPGFLDWPGPRPGARAESHAAHHPGHPSHYQPPSHRLDHALHTRHPSIQHLTRGQQVAHQLALLRERDESMSTHHLREHRVPIDQELGGALSTTSRQSLIDNVMRLEQDLDEALGRAERAESRASMLEAQAAADFELLIAAQDVREEIQKQHAAEIGLLTRHVKTWMSIALEAEGDIAEVRADMLNQERARVRQQLMPGRSEQRASIAAKLEENAEGADSSLDQGLQLLLFFAQNTSLISSTLGRLLPPGTTSPLPSPRHSPIPSSPLTLRSASPPPHRGRQLDSNHSETRGTAGTRHFLSICIYFFCKGTGVGGVAWM